MRHTRLPTSSFRGHNGRTYGQRLRVPAQVTVRPGSAGLLIPGGGSRLNCIRPVADNFLMSGNRRSALCVSWPGGYGAYVV